MEASSSPDRSLDPALPAPVSKADAAILMGLARESIQLGAETGTGLTLDVPAFSPRLQSPGASFVTLHLDGDLRGCIGSLEAYRPLVVDVVQNADSAARRDHRFGPVTPEEATALQIHIALLGPQVSLAVSCEAALLDSLEPGLDGLTLEAPPAHRATFLPQVWEQLPDPLDFLGQLKRKAGLPADHWSPEMEFWRYRMIELG